MSAPETSNNTPTSPFFTLKQVVGYDESSLDDAIAKDPKLKDTLTTGEKLIAVPSNGSGIIDVIQQCRIAGNDISPTLKQRLPFVILKEYKMTTNAAISLASYFINQNKGEKLIANSLEQLRTQQQTTEPGRRSQSVQDATNALSKQPNGTASRVTLKTVAEKVGYNPALANTDLDQQGFDPAPGDKLNPDNIFEFPLSVYSNLYLTQPTGFQYVFPYFSDVRTDITNEFTPTQDKTTGGYFSDFIGRYDIKEIITKIGGTADSLANLLQPRAPGVYIENPKFYNFNKSNETFNISFHLINTYDSGKDVNSMIKKHHDLIYLLTLQNLPYRRTFTQIDPPKLYSLIIPGQIFLPYAYISKLTVDFIGNRRLISIASPGGSGSRETIIPEAYKVNITVTGLTAPAGNFMTTPILDSIKTNSVTGERSLPGNNLFKPSDNAPSPPNAVSPPATPPTLNQALPTSLQRGQSILGTQAPLGITNLIGGAANLLGIPNR